MSSPDLIDTTLRVVTWNIWWRFGDWRTRQPLILDTLDCLGADIILLQEVWVDDKTSAAAVVAEALDMAHVTAPWHDFDGVVMANAILSRWPITGSERLTYSNSDDFGARRGALRADINGPRGAIQAFTTHLNWRIDHGGRRVVQVAELLDFIASAPDRKYPVILGGDFNADPHSDEIRMITGHHRADETPMALFDAWMVAEPERSGWTWDNENPHVAAALQPDRRIDYVFCGWPRPTGAGQVLAAEVVQGSGSPDAPASDHASLVVDIRY